MSLGRLSAGAALRITKAQVISSFVEQIEAEVPEIRGLDRTVIVNLLPQFLDQIIENLEQPANAAPVRKLEELGRSHAAQRFSLMNYSLEQLLTEYRIVRKQICRAVFSKTQPTQQEAESVHEAIDHAIAQAGAHFLRISHRATAAFDAHIDSAPYGIAMLDTELRYLRINKPLADLNGLRPEDHIGKTVREALPTEADRLEPALKQILSSGEPLLNQEVRVRPPGDPEREHSILCNYYPVKDQAGAVIGIGGIVIDVSELRDATETIELQSRTIDSILSALPDVVFMIDRNKRISYANPALLKLWGKTLDEAKGKNLTELGYPEHLVKLHEGQMDQVFRTKAGLRGENAFTTASGETAYFENVFVPVTGTDGNVKYIAGAARDISHRKQAEEALQRAISNREEVLAVVSHDLRNPLGSILMTASLLKRMPNRGEQFVRAQVEKIQRAAERMNELIEDLLNLAKIEAGHFSLSKREICGCNIVLEAVETFRDRAQEKQIRIETRGTDQPLQMSCDHAMVLRVFSNLISNAIKFTPEYGLIEITAEDLGPEVRFCVKDTGPGIAEHHVPNIFERFWQAKKTSHLGTGLGLAIAKGIVEAHGGRIWVESRFGHGASFYFTLPKASALGRNKVA